MKNFTQKFIRILAILFTMSFTINAQDENCNNYFLHCNDSYGDGWDGAFITINGVNYCDDFLDGSEQIETLPCNIIDNLCTISISTGMFGSEVTWKITNEYSESFEIGGPYQSETTIVVNEWDGSCVIYGCMDESASNFNSMAAEQDESCLYPGCTDSNYLEYDETANSDDGSCSCFNSVEINLEISSANPFEAVASLIGDYSPDFTTVDELLMIQ